MVIEWHCKDIIGRSKVYMLWENGGLITVDPRLEGVRL